MSEYFDHCIRWEPLAEFHFNIDDDEELYDDDDDNYVYCLCSRAFLRDGTKTYYVKKENASESDVEALPETASQDDNSRVQFPVKIAHKAKFEKDEASCYCSASHTENCCSTDEHDPVQIHKNVHGLQPSDSGADLTFPDFHSDSHYDKSEQIHMNFPPEISETNEDYLLEDTWDKFWAVNGERIIWASWIKKYSDYINPAYLNENNDLVVEENNMPKQQSVDEIQALGQTDLNFKSVDEENIRERKFSYDSKVNPYKKSKKQMNDKIDTIQADEAQSKDDAFLPIGRRRSCSEHIRVLSPRTIIGTDSMTNVTKITLSSYDVTSSHVTSESSPTDGYSVSSSPTDDQSNDQTRIANIDAILDTPVEEMDTDQYWQFLWKKHFGEQYALHYANYIESHENDNLPSKNVQDAPQDYVSCDVLKDDVCENSKGTQELPPGNKVQSDGEENMTHDTKSKPEKSNVYKNSHSLGCLLETIRDESEKKDSSPEPKKKDEINGAGKEKGLTEHNLPPLTVEGENGDGNSLELPSVIEVQAHVKDMKIEDKVKEPEAQTKKKSRRYLHSMAYLLETIRQDESIMQEKEQGINEVCDAGDKNCDKNEPAAEKGNTSNNDSKNSAQPDNKQEQSSSNNSCNSYSDDDGEDDPPEDKPVSIKRSHELDEEEKEAEKIKKTFQIMGFCIDENRMPKGQLVYRKRNVRLRPLRSKKMGVPRKTYFDDDGNPIPVANHNQDVQLPSTGLEMQTDECTEDLNFDEAADTTTETDTASKDYDVQNKPDSANVTEDIALEASQAPLPDFDTSFSDIQDDSEHNTEDLQVGSINKRKRRQKRSKIDCDENIISAMPANVENAHKIMKYWKRRHSLFHRFDEGIKLDHESFFSVTPESVARHIAKKCVYDTVLDAFCGAGGNTIQFARVSKKVIAIDIDPVKIELARHNATVYGVCDKIEFIVGDFFELASSLHADMVFLSPPWGGPEYSQNAHYDLESMLLPRPASQLMAVARQISHNVALYVPRNSKTEQILDIAKEAGGSVEIEQSFLDRRFVAITAYFY